MSSRMKQSPEDERGLKQRISDFLAKPRHRQQKIRRYMSGKLMIVYLTILLVFALLGVYLFFLIRGTHSDYSVEVLSRHGYTSQVIQARRGSIVDRNGIEVARSEPFYILILDPKVINYSENYTETTINAVADMFGLDRAQVAREVAENADASYLRFGGKTLLTYDQVSAFEEYQQLWNDKKYTRKAADGTEIGMTDEEKKTKIKGVWFEIEYQRTYPYEDLASKVIGFASTDGSEGIWGLERYYDEQLLGTPGRSLSYLDEDYDLERTVFPATSGNTVVSTIDIPTQRILQENVDSYMKEVGADHVGVILMNPRTFEVLGMATDSEFDLNNPTDLSAWYTDEQLAAMTEDELTEARSTVWRNYCISDSYEPGSTGKVVTLAAGLAEKSIELGHTYECDGHEYRGGWKIQCSHTEGHGLLTTEQAIYESCNDVLMQMATQIGKEDMLRYERMMNFGQLTGIDLPGEASCEGLQFTEDTMGEAELATASFGQGYNVTMIQMAAAYCSLINGGYYYQPRTVREIRNASGEVVQRMDPVLVRRTVSEEVSAEIREIMHGTVERGTGNVARIAGYYWGGKTGAAEKLPRGSENYTISYISFVGENPELLLYVVLDVPKIENQSQSITSVFFSREIWSDLLAYYNIFPDEAYLNDGEVVGATTDNPYVSDAFPLGEPVIVINPDAEYEPSEN